MAELERSGRPRNSDTLGEELGPDGTRLRSRSRSAPPASMKAASEEEMSEADTSFTTDLETEEARDMVPDIPSTIEATPFRTHRIASSPWVRPLKPTEQRHIPEAVVDSPAKQDLDSMPSPSGSSTDGSVVGSHTLYQRRKEAVVNRRLPSSLTMDAINTFVETIPEEEPTRPSSKPSPKSPRIRTPINEDLEVDELQLDESPPARMRFIDFLLYETSVMYTPNTLDMSADSKRRRIYNFLQIPVRLERLLKFGFMVCVDSFLYIFTFLPLRVFLAILALIFKPVAGRYAHYDDKISDLIKAGIVAVISFCLCFVDTSVLYHYIRGQSVLKIYVVYNVLEILEKLCCSFGQDIMDTILEHNRGSLVTHMWSAIVDFTIACIYVLLHTSILLLQVLTLNVAVNGSSNALLTLLISNNFVEIKSNVFKKFHVENVFQISCSDMVERFQITIFLTIVIHQNLVNMQWSFGALVDQLVNIFLPVFGMECVIDWIKHGFITKFNQIPPETYYSYAIILYNDVASCRMKQQYADASYLVSRRIGFVPLPLACLVIRMLLLNRPIGQSVGGLSLLLIFFACLFTLKILMTIIILGSALRRGRMASQEDKTYAANHLKEVERYEMSKSRIP